MNIKESFIRYSVADGSSILIPFSKFEKMTDTDFKDLDTGWYGKFPHITEDILDINTSNADDDKLDDEIFSSEEE